jgi:hypothetical protein
VTATDPQPDDPRAGGDGARPEDLKRGGRKFLWALIALIIVVAIAVALSNLGGDDDPSGGGEEGMGATVTLELPGSG